MSWHDDILEAFRRVEPRIVTFDRSIAETSDRLAALARQALTEHKAGLTEELDPDCLRIPERHASSANCWPHCRATLDSRLDKHTNCFPTVTPSFGSGSVPTQTTIDWSPNCSARALHTSGR